AAVTDWAHLEVPGDGHAREDATGLGHHRDAALDDQAGVEHVDALTTEDDLALRWLDQPEDGLHGGRLAGGVAAQQTDDLALVQVVVDALENVQRPVVGVHVLDFEDRLTKLMNGAVPLWIRCFARLSTHHALILSLSKDPVHQLVRHARVACQGKPRSPAGPAAPTPGRPRRSSCRSRARPRDRRSY